MNELDIIRNHFLGFHNDFFDNFRSVSTYPPYNIREKNDLGVIEFAVAGFAEKDLKVEVKDQTLHVYGCKEEKKSAVKNFLLGFNFYLFWFFGLWHVSVICHF